MSNKPAGGIGDPKKRAREKVARDVECGLVSAEEAQKVYGYNATKREVISKTRSS